MAQGSRLRALGKSQVRTLKLTIAYDGTRYAGWQVQENKPTIQATLEQVLKRILRERVKVVGSGRTDAGVHALAQVAHVRISSTLPRDRLLRSLNQVLPLDIAVTQIEEAPASFHARFRTRSKQYRYRIFTGEVVTPFLRPYVHHVRIPLNVSLMRREAMRLQGRHDFRGFASAGATTRTTIRTISVVRLVRRGPELHLELEGDGFLQTMVRSIAGTLLDIGRGRLASGTVQRILRTGDRRLAGTTAPAQGLILVSVTYG